MSFTADQKAALAAPLEKGNVKEREQAGRKLSYLEAWRAIDEANRIFGFDGWTRETVDLRQLGEPGKVGETMRVGYSARVRITVFAGDRAIVREGCGFGQGIDRDQDQAHESALKEAESDAMKRALMTFGNPFGLALYDKTQANVKDGPTRNTAKVAAAVKAIATVTDPEAIANWSTINARILEGTHPADLEAIEAARKARAVTIGVMSSTGARPASQMNGAPAAEVFS